MCWHRYWFTCWSAPLPRYFLVWHKLIANAVNQCTVLLPMTFGVINIAINSRYKIPKRCQIAFGNVAWFKV
jgi:hypothetical protein